MDVPHSFPSPRDISRGSCAMGAVAERREGSVRGLFGCEATPTLRRAISC
jgi:hypothetical protein